MERNFNDLINNMRDSIKGYDYFVCWDKVIGNTGKVEIPLNILNTLIGKQNILDEFRYIIKEYPEVVPVIPMCLAIRESKIDIFDNQESIIYKFYKKKEYTNEEIQHIVDFSEKTGFLNILKNKNIKNLSDYYFGIEVGLDTNARKNRTGNLMENLVEQYLKKMCKQNNISYISQATSKKIESEFNEQVPTDKSSRRYDFAIKKGKEIILIETNFYNGGGSKLKATAGEFITLNNLINKNENTKFVWITDGKGWETAKNPLEEAFNEIDNILNIKDLENGVLEDIVIGG
ncbi:type II restriction endonuclease [Peptoniphilus stercorisuis]|uniref:Type-2 restriction enzyme n=1 Tax=Peptoniphilus stercorisuis TaxID=1436965 RepID=A0ABS4K9Q0_9FIRM|nr:type II restriction endonuclease [Peptoniphilus stercorisuis]MBP2024506.1 type II restriction enzyme [Peptoniphilus stercorisuis]